MNDRLEFSAAFIERHPDGAARALRALTDRDVAALLEALPEPAAARALDGMGPLRAVTIVRVMGGKSAARVLGSVSLDRAAAVLRLADAELRAALLAELPDLVRQQVADSLEYPPDSVGALMSRSIVALNRRKQAADAIAAVRESGTGGSEYVFVTDNEHRVTGMLAASSLLTSKAGVVLEQLSEPPPVLPSRSSVTAIIDHEAWFDYDALPVVNRDRQLIGALTHRELRRWLGNPGSAVRPPSASILLSMSEDLVDSVAGLGGLMLDIPSGPGRSTGKRG